MIAENWIRRRDEAPLLLDSRLELYRGLYGPGEHPILVKASRPGNALGELARSLEQQYQVARAVGPGATPQPVYFGPYRDRIILALEEVRGKTVAQLLGTRPWPVRAALELGIGVLKALQVFHRAGWLHRAVRPDHVIRDDTGRIMLIGLGNARYMDDFGPDFYKLPGSSEDRMYIAPEQTGRLARPCSWRTDIYAVGVLLYTLLAGRPPFDNQDPVATLYDSIAVVPPAPGSFRDEPIPFLDAVVAKAMAKDPDQRYQTIHGFIHDLELASQEPEQQHGPAEYDRPESCFTLILSAHQTYSRLNQGEMYTIMSEMFPGDPEMSARLSGLALVASGGKLDDLEAFFSSMAGEGKIWFDAPHCKWRVVEHAFDDVDLPVTLESSMPEVLASLGEVTLRFLECATCEGQVFDPDAVAAILRSRQSREDLTGPALAAGIIVPWGEGGRRYRFSHESIARRLREGVESIRMSAWHNAFAKRYEAAGRPDLALHHLLADPLKPQAREEAVQRALVLIQAGASRVYDDPARTLELLDKAWQSAGPASWQEDPGLAVDLSLLIMNCASRLGDFHAFDTQCKEAMRMAPAKDLPRIEEAAVRGLSASGRSSEALNSALEALDRLGLKITRKPGKAGTVLAFVSSLLILRGDGMNLAKLPDMTEPEARMALGIIATAGPPAYLSKPETIPFLAAAGLRLCRRYGFHPQSAVLCAAMGMIAINRLGWNRLGQRLGQLADRLSSRPSRIDAYAQSRYVVISFINHWFKSSEECLEACLDAGRAGRSTGEHDYGSHAYASYFQQSILSGKELTAIAVYLPEVREALTAMNQELPILVFRATVALMDGLKEAGNPPGTASIEGRTLRDWQSEYRREGYYYVAGTVALYRVLIGYLYEDLGEARQAIEDHRGYASSLEGTASGMFMQIFDSLLDNREALATVGEGLERSGARRSYSGLMLQERRKARQRLRRLRARLLPLAEINPVVYEPRLLLVTALLQFHRGREMKSFDTFERAVSRSRTAGSHLDEVMVCAEFAACLASTGRQTLAHFYQRAVYTALVRWGASGVAEAMALKYPSIKAWVSTSPHSSQGSGLLTLDAEALLKASAVIAAEREGSGLLNSLLDVTMTTSGARFGSVWIPRGDSWDRVASSTHGTSAHDEGARGEESGAVPSEQLRTCCELQRTLVGGFRNGSGSLAHIPLLSRGTAHGVLELGNEYVAGAFPPERMKIVEAIAAQASIFIENAELYANLERKVAERTRDLEDALRNVRQLRGLIPICSSCKKVRDDTGYWGQVEEYISARTEADFTHGLCPECLEHYYDELDIELDARKKESL